MGNFFQTTNICECLFIFMQNMHRITESTKQITYTLKANNSEFLLT